ncbi:MAG: tripartite tricarboxylate transporter substrate-binding protein [Hyphomicrobiales bacterium]
MNHASALASFVVAAWALGGAASAQTFPNRPITLVVPFAAGGATDAIARVLVDSLSQNLGQQIVIETVGGAGGMIGSARVARAAPDGYTILLHQVGLAAGMTLYPNPSFDAEKDLTGIGLVNTSASTVTGRKTLPPNTMAELVTWMKEPGQNTKVAHAGVGAFGHLCGVLFVQELGAKADQIPYRGGGPALNDLVAGHADLSCLSAAVVEPQVKGGNLKVYGIVGKRRFAGLPGVPTLGEAGYKNLDLDFWHILFAPAGTPRPVIDRLNAALRQSLADARVKEAFEKNGMDLYPPDQESPEIATAMLKSEIARWGDVIRANKITAQ